MSNEDTTNSKSKQILAKPVEPAEINLNVLIKFIKQFDGTREKLNPFLSNCKNAYSLATQSQKPVLFKYILSQLTDKAETACSIKEFDNWDQLSEFLKTQFGERKHYTHLLTDLQDCRQSINEPVNQFALRVETCLSKLLTEITLSNTKKSELAGRVAAMEDLALHTFTLGLSPKISSNVRCKEPTTLNKAINYAVSEEKIQTSISKRYSQISNPSKPQSYPPRNYSNYNNSFKPRNVHNIISRTHPNPNNQPSQQNSNTPFCRYCKGQGHTIEGCRKREYNNKRFQVQQPQSSAQSSFNNSNRYQPRVHYVNNDDHTFTHGNDQTQLYDSCVQTQHEDSNDLNA